MLDIKIAKGQVVDGTGAERFRGDIGLKGDTIVALGDLDSVKAELEIDAQGLVAAPGFIDAHSHSDLIYLRNPSAEDKILQGITTEIAGSCGLSPAPRTDTYARELAEYTGPVLGSGDIDWNWHSFPEFMDLLEGRNLNLNIALQVGHNTLRLAVMGLHDGRPGKEEMAEMKRLAAEAMEAGAIGISSGLIYLPGMHAGREELAELCEVAADYGGLYTTHIRNEAGDVVNSCREAITIGARAGLPVHISHHKVTGPSNWGQTEETLYLITKARAEGQKVTCDQYPYTAGSTIGTTLLPPWVKKEGVQGLVEKLKNEDVRRRIKQEFKSGLDWNCQVKELGWNRLMIAGVESRAHAHLEGLTFLKAAAEEGTDPAELLFDLIIASNGNLIIILFQQLENDLRRVMRYPHTMFGTDGIFTSKPHPRLCGSFPRILEHYVREKELLSLENAIRKMTFLTARTFGLQDRGLIRKGYRADIVLFDPEQIRDTATYTEPLGRPEGIEKVIVNGRIAVEEGKLKNLGTGRVLRRE